MWLRNFLMQVALIVVSTISAFAQKAPDLENGFKNYASPAIQNGMTQARSISKSIRWGTQQLTATIRLMWELTSPRPARLRPVAWPTVSAGPMT